MNPKNSHTFQLPSIQTTQEEEEENKTQEQEEENRTQTENNGNLPLKRYL